MSFVDIMIEYIYLLRFRANEQSFKTIFVPSLDPDTWRSWNAIVMMLSEGCFER
jgi:hypothetical protein